MSALFYSISVKMLLQTKNIQKVIIKINKRREMPAGKPEKVPEKGTGYFFLIGGFDLHYVGA
ncbi:MAG TPA: hypothetical protein ENH65_13045 [Candidatus Aminicenantes bacterium]|nr:hypothetical protein [Candidatus Aminicenantes bacterium]HEB35977.1 hypothetical protein [Candidatus Aminicenantes bacterium]